MNSEGSSIEDWLTSEGIVDIREEILYYRALYAVKTLEQRNYVKLIRNMQVKMENLRREVDKATEEAERWKATFRLVPWTQPSVSWDWKSAI